MLLCSVKFTQRETAVLICLLLANASLLQIFSYNLTHCQFRFGYFTSRAATFQGLSINYCLAKNLGNWKLYLEN